MSQLGLNVLLIGKGGREHALAWKLTQSERVAHVYVVPGNGGTAALDGVSNIRHVQANDYQGLLSLAKELHIGLVVAGPDDAVIDGVEGYFRESGIPCFAPTKEAAEVEGSKKFAKDFMLKYGIPTAAYQAFEDYELAKKYLQQFGDATRVVIKVDGLAAGKGVVLPVCQAEAQHALHEIMVERKFGTAGDSIVIEEFMEGDEISVLTFSDGKTFKSFPVGQDHKRIFENNQGPNTGGMGVYAPVPFLSPEQMTLIENTILEPTFDGLQCEGRTFVGLLFTGIMMTPSGPQVLEYNARFGDPETQTMMMLLAPQCDLAEILLACCTGSLATVPIPILTGHSCNVVVASGGYPDSYSSGKAITLQPCPKGVQIFHAGTELKDGTLRTAGGRVFSVAAHGETLKEAVSLAYRGVESIKFDDMYYRKDIARRALRATTSEL